MMFSFLFVNQEIELFLPFGDEAAAAVLEDFFDDDDDDDATIGGDFAICHG